MNKSSKIIPKNYNSIPHLSISKLTQQADKKISMEQELLLTKKSRDYKDLIIVTEKIDGSNVGVCKKGNNIYAVTRSGYNAGESEAKHLQLFAEWVKKRNDVFMGIPDGWRVVGEWCAQAHGTVYNITDESPFMVFDIFDESNNPLAYIKMICFCARFGFTTIPLLHIGQPISIRNAVKLLGQGHYGNPDKPEGVVYRLEREGKFIFRAKWVRHDKEDGKYMKEEIMNVGYEKIYE